MLKERIEKISAQLEQNEGFIITSSSNRQYVTGFRSSAGTVLITKTESFLFIDSRYFEKASATVKHLKVILAKNTVEQIKETLEKYGIDFLYTETSNLSVDEYKRFSEKFSPVTVSDNGKMDNLVTEYRAVKDSSEIECIKAAQVITDLPPLFGPVST